MKWNGLAKTDAYTSRAIIEGQAGRLAGAGGI